MSYRPKVDAPIGDLTISDVTGGKIEIGGTKARWTMLFVYRGRHCPRCKRFLNKLNAALSDWSNVMDVVVVSSDTKEKALADKDEHGWTFTLGYGMTEGQMRSLGLYVSDPLSDAETTGRFAEPGAFGIRPDGSLMLVDTVSYTHLTLPDE